MIRSVKSLRAAILLSATFGFLSAFSGAAVAGPLDGLAGDWNGSGTLNMKDGSGERLTCRASYEVAANRLKLNLVCATDGSKTDARAQISVNDGFLSGNWQEMSRNLAGEVSGNVSGNTINANLESGGAPLLKLKMVTTGATQSIRIVAQDGAPIKSAQINMTRK